MHQTLSTIALAAGAIVYGASLIATGSAVVNDALAPLMPAYQLRATGEHFETLGDCHAAAFAAHQLAASCHPIRR